MKKLILLFSLLMMGCASLNSVSLTSIPAKKDHEIRAQASRVIVLGLNFDNDYVDQLDQQLKQQCPNGVVRGILTKDEIIDYFIMIVHQRRVTATGYCMQARNTASTDDGEMK